MCRAALTILLYLTAPLALASAQILNKDGYSIRPPLGFEPVRLDPYRGTRLGVIGAEPQGFVSAAYANDKIEGTPTMVISVVRGKFSPTPRSRDEFALAVVKHFEELKLKFAVDRVELLRSRTPRVELTGTLIDEGNQRHLFIAAMPGRARHQIVVFSLPIGELPRLVPQIRASLETFVSDQGSTFWTGDKFAVIAALLGAGVLAWMFLSQNRKGARPMKAARK